MGNGQATIGLTGTSLGNSDDLIRCPQTDPRVLLSTMIRAIVELFSLSVCGDKAWHCLSDWRMRLHTSLVVSTQKSKRNNELYRSDGNWNQNRPKQEHCHETVTRDCAPHQAVFLVTSVLNPCFWNFIRDLHAQNQSGFMQMSSACEEWSSLLPARIH